MRSVKQPLNKCLGHLALNDEELYTILAEVECIVSDRPITYVYDDEESVSYPLTHRTWLMVHEFRQCPIRANIF